MKYSEYDKEDLASCFLTAIAMRKEPSHRSEMVNQILFGESMWITDDQGEWVKVKLLSDTYEGWVSAKQLTVHEEAIERNAIATKPVKIIFNGRAVTIPIGSYYNTEWLPRPVKRKNYTTAKDPVAIAMQFLGAPYLWGGRTVMGIDCSGLTQVSFKCCGITLLRDASMQAKQGDEVAFDERKAGDLAFFENEDGNIIHVGIVMDDSKIIHSSGEVRIDTLDTKGIINSDSGNYSHRLKLIRRVSES